MRIRDYGIDVGSLPTGKLNKISDVPGVSVGHSTVISEKHQTGVSVVMPCADNPFLHKLPAACFVLNGYGKTAGLVQIDELGTLETPIALTNTLNVGLIHDAMTGYMIDRCAADGVGLTSVNPIVCECNDSRLNNITERVLGKENLLEAISGARADFEEGAVGAGRGMSCHGLKGGIGSASRVLAFDGESFAVGVLVLTNHGKIEDLTVNGDAVGKRISGMPGDSGPERGSCIVILATDLPLCDRQIRRVLKRCPVGMARLGSYVGQGSGEIFVGFSTANRYDTGDRRAIRQVSIFDDAKLDAVFRAAAESTEEAILNAMAAAETVTGYRGFTRRSLSEYL